MSMTEHLLPCPLCNKRPHWQLSKVWYDSLHGDPHQDRIVVCPLRHVKVERPNDEIAIEEWNTRALGPALDVVLEAVEQLNADDAVQIRAAVKEERLTQTSGDMALALNDGVLGYLRALRDIHTSEGAKE